MSRSRGGGGLRKCDSLWQGGKDRVTSPFPFFHNSQFYVLLYIYQDNTNLSCNYHLRSCKKNKLVRVFHGLLETPNMVFCYCLKYSRNDYSYLKQSPFSIFMLTFCSEVWHILLGRGSRFVTVCDRGRGSKIIKNSVTYFMDSSLVIPRSSVTLVLPDEVLLY